MQPIATNLVIKASPWPRIKKLLRQFPFEDNDSFASRDKISYIEKFPGFQIVCRVNSLGLRDRIRDDVRGPLQFPPPPHSCKNR